MVVWLCGCGYVVVGRGERGSRCGCESGVGGWMKVYG